MCFIISSINYISNTDELVESVEDYVSYVVEQLENVKNDYPMYIAAVEQKVDVSSYVDDCFGTADMVIVSPDKLHIIDLKLGKGVPVYAENNTQLAIEQVKKESLSVWGGKVPANLKTPLRDGDTDIPDDEAYKDSYFFNANSKQKPQVVDNKVEPIIDQSEVYSGCYGNISVSFGLGGKGGAETRKALLKNLKGHSAFRTEEELEKAKGKYRQKKGV